MATPQIVAPSAPTGELPAPALPRYGNRPMDIQQRHFDRARELKSQFENQYGPITTKDQDRQFQSFLQSQMGSFTDSASFATSVASGMPSTTGSTPLKLSGSLASLPGYNPNLPDDRGDPRSFYPGTTPGTNPEATVGHFGISTLNDFDVRDYASPLPITPPGTPTPGTTPGAPTGGTPITTNIDPSQSTLAPNFSSYVYNMLGKGEAAANLPYQEYMGQRFAGPSELQQQAFKGIGALGPSLGTQAGIGAAATALGGLQNLQPYQQAQINVPGVTAQQIFADYKPPTPFTGANIQSTFQAPSAYQAGTFQTGYTPGTFDTGLGALKSVQEYMSPYQQSVIDIQAREARRQADIARQGEQARLAQAGAYGGSRQAIMEAERQRNLGQQIGDIQERGLQSAYDRAMQQRLQEAGMGLQAQQYGEQARQFGTTAGLQAQQMGEASRQFAAQQGMTAQQLQAQFGLDAAKANELSRQFGYQQQMTAQQLQAQFGLDAAKANQMAALQASQATQNAAMEAQRLQEQSRQFGANLGLQGLQAQLSGAATLGTLGGQEFQQQLNTLQQQLTAGKEQQALEQQPLDFAYKQFQESMQYPFQQATYMQSLLQGLPITARPYDSGQSGMASLLQGGLGGLALFEALKGKKGD